jgi:flagellar biosynthesis chaperone FliJ
MANTSEKANRSATEILGGFETAQQAWRDMLGFQVRTSKTLIEQGMGFTRRATEHFITQLDEGVKLQQDAIKYSLHLMDDFKKVAFETAEKAVRPEMNA